MELVRYIHLNPLRARMVKDLMELDRYPWSGHSVVMGVNKNAWQNVEEVLLYFSEKIAKAQRAYRRFVEQDIAQARRPDLQISGVLELGREKEAGEIFDLRVLGKGNFVRKVLEIAGMTERPTIRKVPLKDLVAESLGR